MMYLTNDLLLCVISDKSKLICLPPFFQSTVSSNNGSVWCLAANEDRTKLAVSRSASFTFVHKF